jgi:hypothetical protein
MFCVQLTFWDNANPNHTESAIRRIAAQAQRHCL